MSLFPLARFRLLRRRPGRLVGPLPALALGVGLILACCFTLDAARADLPAPTSRASFYAAHTVIWLGRSQVVPFEMAAAPETDLTLAATLTNSDVVAMLRQPAILSGETTGYVRLNGLQPGLARLTLEEEPPSSWKCAAILPGQTSRRWTSSLPGPGLFLRCREPRSGTASRWESKSLTRLPLPRRAIAHPALPKACRRGKKSGFSFACPAGRW